MLPQLHLLSLALPAVLVQANPVAQDPKEQFTKRQGTDWFAGHQSSATLSWYPCYDVFQCARCVQQDAILLTELTHPKITSAFRLLQAS